jgi:hypothetical protein
MRNGLFNMSVPISFNCLSGAGKEACQIHVENLVIAGWTGRDQAALDAHIKELAEMGVTPPKRTPIFYRVGAALLTTAPDVEVIGQDSTGEVEFVLFNEGGELRVGVGSDHTDRKAEAVGVTLSKQMCPKPVAPELWALADVEPHWDELILRSYAVSEGQRSLYQEGKVSAMRHPRQLMDLYGGFPDHTAMFCGTLAVKGKIRCADTFSIELEDPILGRRIAHSYNIRPLPVEG